MRDLAMLWYCEQGILCMRDLAMLLWYFEQGILCMRDLAILPFYQGYILYQAQYIQLFYQDILCMRDLAMLLWYFEQGIFALERFSYDIEAF